MLLGPSGRGANRRQQVADRLIDTNWYSICDQGARKLITERTSDLMVVFNLAAGRSRRSEEEQLKINGGAARKMT